MKGETTVLFGQKEEFGIEIKPCKIPNKFNLRLWIKSKAIGDFKRGGSLDYLIKRYFTLIRTFRELYEPAFSKLSDWEIFDDILMYEAKGFSLEKRDQLFIRSKRYDFTIAENQMNEFSLLLLYVEHNKAFKFLVYEMDGKTDPKFYSFEIPENVFFKTYKSFMMYAFKNGLKKKGLFFPENFSIEDIQ